MSRILFGQSYYLRFDPKLWDAMQPYPPLGTLYAASYMRERGHEVALFDAMLADSETEWEAALAQSRPDFAIIYEDNFNYLSKMCLSRMREAALTMIGMARARGCTVIVCGSDASDHYERYLAVGAHFVLIGEGEATLGELIARLTGSSDQSLRDILGLAYDPRHLPPMPAGNNEREHVPSGDADSPLVVNPRRPDIRDLDALPFPAWDLVDVERYRRIWIERHGYYSMNMVTTRGCPYHCNWCAKPIWGQRYNTRSPENVVAELKWLKSAYRPDHVWFADDILGLKPNWLARFADLVQAEGCAVPFKCLSRADLLLRDGDIDALRRAGCRIVWIGAESGSQKILDAMEKGTQVEQIYQAAERLHAAGLQIGFFLQFGYPGESRADIERTLQMVRDCRPDDIGMSVSYPLPGTKFFEAVKLELGEKQNWVDSGDLAMMYQGPFITDFYRKLHTVLHKEYRARRVWGRLRRTLGRGANRPTLRETAAMAYYWASLPLERMRLDRLAQESPASFAPPAERLSPSAAANPTPQPPRS